MNSTNKQRPDSARLAARLLALLRAVWLPVAVFALGIVITLVIARQQTQDLDAAARARFDREIERTRSAISTRMAGYEDLMLSARGLYATGGTVTASAWRSFVGSLPIEQRYPGLVGLGFVAPTASGQVGALETAARTEGLTNFQVYPQSDHATVYPVRLIEPLQRNQSLLGFDLSADPAQQAAADRARDSGLPTVSARLSLEQHPGFLLLVPVYRAGMPVTNLDQRRAALLGWIYAPIHSDELMQGLLPATTSEIDLEIFDGSAGSVGDLLYTANAGMVGPGYTPALAQKQPITVGDRAWTLGFSTLPPFDSVVDSNQPIFVLYGGIVLSTMLSLLTFSLLNTARLAAERADRMTASLRNSERELRSARDELEIRVVERTAELRHSEEKFRATIENVEEGLFELDLEGRFTFFNPAVQRMSGFSASELLGMHYRKYVLPADMQAVQAAFNAVYRTGNPGREIGYRLTVKDGSEHYFETSVTLVRDDAGKPAGFRGVVRDLTERRAAEQAMRRQNEYLGALQETTLGLISRLDVNELMEDILVRAGKLVGTQHGYLYLLEADEQRMQMRVGTGVQNAYVGNYIKQGEGLAGRVWDSGKQLVVNDYPNWPERLHSVDPNMLRAVAGVPLKSGDKIAGVIGMSYLEEGRAFGESELEVLNRFAQLASIALDNARLFAQAQRRVGELEIINSVSRSLNTQLDTNALVELVGEAIRQTLHMPISYVALYDQQTQLIHFPYWVEGAQRMSVGPFVMGQGLTSVVLRTRQPLLINHDADRITAELGGRHTGGTSVKSYLGVPIPLGDEVIGVLSAQSTEREGLFEEGDVRLLTTIAANVGVAIQNARLFEHEQQRARREQILREVTTQVRKSVDIQTIMRTTVQEVGQVLGRRAFIKLGNGEEQG